MRLDHARRLLDRLDFLVNPCDLDLLVFFARHPRTLLAREQLAIFLGYEFEQVAALLDVLQRAGLVVPSTVSASAATADMPLMYAYEGDAGGGSLPDLLELAATREGRRALVQALRERPAEDRQAVPRVEQAPTAGPGRGPDPGPTKRDVGRRRASNKRRKRKGGGGDV